MKIYFNVRTTAVLEELIDRSSITIKEEIDSIVIHIRNKLVTTVQKPYTCIS